MAFWYKRYADMLRFGAFGSRGGLREELMFDWIYAYGSSAENGEGQEEGKGEHSMASTLPIPSRGGTSGNGCISSLERHGGSDAENTPNNRIHTDGTVAISMEYRCAPSPRVRSPPASRRGTHAAQYERPSIKGIGRLTVFYLRGIKYNLS